MWIICIFSVVFCGAFNLIQGLNFKLESLDDKRHCYSLEALHSETHSCYSLNFFLDRHSNETLNQIFSKIETANTTVRQAKISFHLAPTPTEMLHIGARLDKFLGPNMWWSVLAEPFSWHVNNKEGIILERYHAAYEPYLRLLSAVQYPDSQTCSKAPMVVSRASMTHPGWGSIVEYYHSVHLQLPFVPTVSYASISNNPADPKEKTAYMNANECNTTNNKWECAFLLETNCTIPDVLTKCNTTNCVSQYPNTIHMGLLMTTADASGKVMPANEASALREHAYHNHSFIQPYNQKQMTLWKLPHSTNPPGYTQAPIFNTSFPMTSPGLPSSVSATYWYSFLLRSNYRFRSLIAEQIHSFYQKNKVNFNTRCVTAQVRRGDRVVKGVDMVEFCKNATKPITAENPVNYCRNTNGNLENCQAGLGLDKGCTSPVPFGTVTIDMVIKSAEQLVSPEVRTIFLFTDDEPWLIAERARVQHKYPAWKIVNLEAPKADAPWGTPVDQEFSKNFAEGYIYMRSQGGSKSGSFYLASLQLAQQCEAFIGHHDSAATGMFKASMCYKSKNGLQQGICPPVYDLRTGKV